MSCKTLLLALGAVLFMTLPSQVFAEARAFRVESDSATGRYAVAWGIPGEQIDFEAIEAQGDEAVEQFADEHFSEVVNYVVDLQRNEILAQIEDPNGNVAFELGGRRFGDRYRASLVAVRGLVANQDVVFVLGHAHWESQIAEALLVDHSGGHPQVKAVQKDLQTQLETQVRKKLPSRFRKNLEQMVVLTDLQEIAGDTKKQLAYTYEGFVPEEREETQFLAEGNVRVQLKNGRVSLEVLTLSVRQP